MQHYHISIGLTLEPLPKIWPDTAVETQPGAICLECSTTFCNYCDVMCDVNSGEHTYFSIFQPCAYCDFQFNSEIRPYNYHDQMPLIVRM